MALLAKNIPLFRNCTVSRRQVTSQSRVYGPEAKHPGTKLIVQNTIYNIGAPGSAVDDIFDTDAKQSTISTGYKYKPRKNEEGGDADPAETPSASGTTKSSRKKRTKSIDKSLEEGDGEDNGGEPETGKKKKKRKSKKEDSPSDTVAKRKHPDDDDDGGDNEGNDSNRAKGETRQKKLKRRDARPLGSME